MNNTTKMILFVTAIIAIMGLAIFGLSKIKVDDFHKAAVILVVDASASNQQDLPAQKMLIRQLCSMLDPEDQIKILRVSETSYLIYEGSPQASSDIRKSLEKFTQYDEKEYGTAYGLSLDKAFNHAMNMYKDGYVPAVVVIGDLANEGKVEHQINWEKLPQKVKEIKDNTENFTMMFLFAPPDKLDLAKESLSPVLGETNLIIGNDTTSNKSLRRFLTALGR